MSAPDTQPRLIHCPTSPLRPILDSLQRVARSRAPVLVTGESGTGKEGIVRLIHKLAPWGKGPFVPVNCGAIPSSLLESELFGHVRGAFTGADRNRVGRFEAASGGTLFLDEIGETPPDFQVKLLRVLQERVFVPVGTSTPRPAEVRVVAATNIDVLEAVQTGRLREDLFFRLDVIRIELPALRDRLMDIPALARHFIVAHAGSNMSRIDDITPDAIQELQCHHWPGNVRELENVIQSILVRKESGAIERDDVRFKLGRREPIKAAASQPHSAYLAGLEPVVSPLADVAGTQRVRAAETLRQLALVREDGCVAAPEPRRTLGDPPLLPAEGMSLKETLERLERDYIRQALTRAKGNRAHAATLLGLNRTTLVEKLRRMPEWGGGEDPASTRVRARPASTEVGRSDELSLDLLDRVAH